MEIWKDVKGHEEAYRVSNLGRVKSLDRTIKTSRGSRVYNGRILSKTKNYQGYEFVRLSKGGSAKSFTVHSLIACAFLNHKASGHKLVVNHINFDKLDNNVNNLEIITQRENTNKKHCKSTSKYTGVSWSKTNGKWISIITIKGRKEYLGYYKCELAAAKAYQDKLKTITIKK